MASFEAFPTNFIDGADVYPLPGEVMVTLLIPEHNALRRTVFTALTAAYVGPLTAFSASANISRTSAYLSKGKLMLVLDDSG